MDRPEGPRRRFPKGEIGLAADNAALPRGAFFRAVSRRVGAAIKGYRFPRELIAQAVWLYFRFPLSFRLVEEMLLERGIVVSYETIVCSSLMTLSSPAFTMPHLT
ncbi:hypothetical protein AA105894_2366 [Asaia spathodeae NBRC 105894]|nr:hypothetical protein AA105894_2366 [Asaia spathodeae NBRC 105894]